MEALGPTIEIVSEKSYCRVNYNENREHVLVSKGISHPRPRKRLIKSAMLEGEAVMSMSLPSLVPARSSLNVCGTRNGGRMLTTAAAGVTERD
jgi:hypothetical protein